MATIQGAAFNQVNTVAASHQPFSVQFQGFTWASESDKLGQIYLYIISNRESSDNVPTFNECLVCNRYFKL